MTAPDASRRRFVKGSVYVAPAILTLTAAPAFAKSGSAKPDGGKNKPLGKGDKGGKGGKGA